MISVARLRFNIAMLVVSLATCLTAIPAQGTTLVDDFSESHDYTAGSVAGTIWDGAFFNSGFDATQNTTVFAANSNLSSAGRLTLSTAGGDWGGAGDDGFFLFHWVGGDFTATVQVISANQVNYHDLGLMARAGNEADGGLGEDYVAGRYFAAGTITSLRSIDGGAETDTDSAGTRSFLKLERTGNLFTYTRADDSDFSVNTVITSVMRNDLDGLPLQVGIWQATFTGSTGTAVFDNFALTVPEPSVGCLVGGGLLVLLRRRRPV